MRKFMVLSLLAVLVLCALPAGASQFIATPFEKLVRGSVFVVHATVGPVTSNWDSDHEVIFSTADLSVNEYLLSNGPAALTIREVGGTVAGYTQQAIGFPELREGEDVVLLLTRWNDGSGDYRIQGYARGKFVVEDNRVLPDLRTQGDGIPTQESLTAREGFDLDEFRTMVGAIERARDLEAATPSAMQVTE